MYLNIFSPKTKIILAIAALIIILAIYGLSTLRNNIEEQRFRKLAEANGIITFYAFTNPSTFDEIGHTAKGNRYEVYSYGLTEKNKAKEYINFLEQTEFERTANRGDNDTDFIELKRYNKKNKTTTTIKIYTSTRKIDSPTKTQYYTTIIFEYLFNKK